MMLNRTLDAVLPSYRELFARHNLTEQQWRVLRSLWDKQHLSHRALAELTLIPASSLVGVIDRLEKRDLVIRFRSVKDRRNVMIKLTAAGHALERKISPELVEVQNQINARLSDSEWNALEQSLAKLSGQQAHSASLQSNQNAKA